MSRLADTLVDWLTNAALDLLEAAARRRPLHEDSRVRTFARL